MCSDISNFHPCFLQYVLKPTFTKKQIKLLDKDPKTCRAYDTTMYTAGIVGLNNIKENDYCNVLLHVSLYKRAISFQVNFVANLLYGLQEQDYRQYFYKTDGTILKLFSFIFCIFYFTPAILWRTVKIL